MNKENFNLGIWMSTLGLIISLGGYLSRNVSESFVSSILYILGSVILVIGLPALIIGLFQKPKKK